MKAWKYHKWHLYSKHTWLCFSKLTYSPDLLKSWLGLIEVFYQCTSKEKLRTQTHSFVDVFFFFWFVTFNFIVSCCFLKTQKRRWHFLQYVAKHFTIALFIEAPNLNVYHIFMCAVSLFIVQHFFLVGSHSSVTYTVVGLLQIFMYKCV